MNGVKNTYDVFLSYNSQDHIAVEKVARYLKERGLTVFLDRWYLVAGTSWIEHLEEVLATCGSVAVFLGPYGMGRWQQREQNLALDLQARQPTFHVIPVLLPGSDPALGFLSLNTWVDLRSRFDDISLSVLTAAIQGMPPGSELQRQAADALASICPYRGLRFFREEDAPFFFGRDEFIERLTRAVNKDSMVAVLGSSGSGKSSVVRAGLLPRLRRSDNTQVWEIATMVPGDQPLQNLAAVIVPLLEPNLSEVDRLIEINKLMQAFQTKTASLRDAVKSALAKQRGTDRLMLVVDQWEELYTLTADEPTRNRFIDELLDATAASPLSIVLTVRGDFYDQVLDYEPLSKRLDGAVVNISRMKDEELAQVIERPAAKVGLQFETGLVNRILTTIKAQPGSLPLLEFLLMELWKHRSEGLLTHAAYDKLGEIQGAIAAHAEAFFTALSESEQEIARRVFLRLVRPAQGNPDPDAQVEAEPTRRRTSFAELGAETLPIVRKLASAHLIVTGRNEATGEEIIDLVHEALIRAWDRLRQWLEDDRAFLSWRERLRIFMNISVAEDYKKNTFLSGNLLTEAQDWLQKRKSDLSEAERHYIELSAAARNRQRIRQIILGVIFAVPLLVLIVFLAINKRTDNGINTNNSPTPANTQNTPITNNSPETDPLDSDNSFPPIETVTLPSGVVTIPVVVHVVYNNAAQNISDEQVKSQIDVLNKDFRAKNDDISKVPEPFKNLIGDAHIEFILATTDPQGRPTNGITRTKTTSAEFMPGDEIKFSNKGGIDAWDAGKYLNIWVCNLSRGVIRYGQLPGGSPETDGIVINYKVFGTLGTVDAKFSKGHTLTGGVGTYLNLRHIWGDKPACTGTDFVDDTPPQAEPNFGKPVFPHITCNNGPNGDMFMNFMDYVQDDAMYMFTKGQVLRMHQTLQGPRKGLGTTNP